MKMKDFYDNWEPKIKRSDLQRYLKTIFANTAFFTRKESLDSFLITLSKITSFLDEPQTKENIKEILKLTDKLHEQIGVGSDVHKIVTNFQRLHCAYEGFGASDAITTKMYETAHLSQAANDYYLTTGMLSSEHDKLLQLIKSKTMSVSRVNSLSIRELRTIINECNGILPLPEKTKNACRKLIKLGVKRELVNNFTDSVTSSTNEMRGMQSSQSSKGPFG
jgi:hypothetical protein